MQSPPVSPIDERAVTTATTSSDNTLVVDNGRKQKAMSAVNDFFFSPPRKKKQRTEGENLRPLHSTTKSIYSQKGLTCLTD